MFSPSLLRSPVRSGPCCISEQCPNGGITVYASIDKNSNGVLDPEEYTGSPQYVCNGSNGNNGTNGNNWPIANAGPDQKVAAAGIMVTVDGSGSSDPDGGIPSYVSLQYPAGRKPRNAFKRGCFQPHVYPGQGRQVRTEPGGER